MNKTRKILIITAGLSLASMLYLSIPQPVVISTYFNDNNDFVIHINPNENNIAGIQADILYDGRYIKIINVSENDFLSDKNHYNTFFYTGNITNSYIKNGFSVIIGNNSTKLPGIYETVNISGYGCMIITDVIIADINGNSIPFVINSSCVLNIGTISGHVK